MSKPRLKRVKTQRVEDLKNNFAYVKDPVLQENLAIATQYLIFLVSLVTEYTLQGPIVYSTYKDIIVYTASITEALINYTLREVVRMDKKSLNEIMGTEWRQESSKVIYTVNLDTEVRGIVVHKKAIPLDSNTKFQELNRAAKRAKLFDDDLFNDAEEIRKRRNKIHIAALENIDDKYSDGEVKDTIDRFGRIRKALVDGLKDEN